MGNATSHEPLDDHDHVILPPELVAQLNPQEAEHHPNLPPLCLVPTPDGKYIVKPRPPPPSRTIPVTFPHITEHISAHVSASSYQTRGSSILPAQPHADEEGPENISAVVDEDEDDEEDDGDGKESGANGGSSGAAGKKWRKYGCKKLKNTRDHRNYFRCTQGSCPAKKIVEVRYSADRPNDPPTQSTTIRGQHNHAEATIVRFEARNQIEFKTIVNSKIFSQQGQQQQQLDQQPKIKMELAEEGSDNDGDICDEENLGTAASSKKKTSREVLIELSAEVNPADDGWQWRKYGRKVVKHSDRTRNYFKCSLKTCPARKKVQSNTPVGQQANPSSVSASASSSTPSSATDPGGYLVSYEERHNHPLPTNGSRMIANNISAMLRETKANLNAASAAATRPAPAASNSQQLDMKKRKI